VDKSPTKITTEWFQIGMVRNHQSNLHRQFTTARAPEQIQQTVALLTHKDGNTGQLIGEVKLCLTTKPVCKGTYRWFNRMPRQPKAIKPPLNPTQKQPCTRVGVVVSVTNVAAIGRHPSSQLTHES
jgi:hypothetical protein